MLLAAHVFTALMSICCSTLSALFPSRMKLYISGFLAVMTGVSGVLVGVEKQASITRLCVSGLAYILVTSGLMAASYRRLKATGGCP